MIDQNPCITAVLVAAVKIINIVFYAKLLKERVAFVNRDFFIAVNGFLPL